MLSFADRGLIVQIVGGIQKAGWIGVDLFFVLSGFLITRILLSTLYEPNYFRNFYLRRTLRIFPLYYGVLALLLLATPILHFRWQGSLPYYLLYIQNFHRQTGLVLSSPLFSIRIDHLWSLAIEEQFYLVWPLLLFLLRGKRNFIYLPLTFMIFCPLARIVAIHAGINPEHLYFWTPYRMDGLAWGGFAAVVFEDFDQLLIRRIRRVCLAVGGVLCLTVLLYLRGTLDDFAPIMGKLFYSSLDMLCCGVILSLMQPDHRLTRIFSASILRWFGRYSYGIYIFHVMLISLGEYLRDAVNRVTDSRPLGAATLISSVFISTISLAYLSFRFYEQPFLRWKNRIASYGHPPALQG
ncbi:MAG: acyltransferase [Granulicella sp.]